jgi:DnaJ-class molecular chaperone
MGEPVNPCDVLRVLRTGSVLIGRRKNREHKWKLINSRLHNKRDAWANWMESALSVSELLSMEWFRLEVERPPTKTCPKCEGSGRTENFRSDCHECEGTGSEP